LQYEIIINLITIESRQPKMKPVYTI